MDMNRIALACLAPCLWLIAGVAAARVPATLPPEEAAALRGRTLTVVTHDARDINLLNPHLLATKEEREQVIAMLGEAWAVNPDSENVMPGPRGGVTIQYGNQAIRPKGFID